MHKLLRTSIYSMLVMSLVMGNVFAKSTKTPKLVSSVKAVENLTQSIDFVKKNSQLAVMFPTEIPEPKKGKLFASQSSLYDKPDYNQYWEIAATTDAKCQAHNCTVGSVSANKAGKLELDYMQAPLGPDAKPILKQKVELTSKITGYYTPGHAEADWHPATMEWQVNDVLYALTWDIAGDAKKVLTTMANSAIQSVK